MDLVDSKINRIKQDDQTLVNEAAQTLTFVDDNISSNVHQDVSDCLDRIQREVQRVKFVEGEVCGEHYGRMDGYIGEWELVKSIDIRSIVNTPILYGLISGDEICVQDEENKATYVTNISTGHTQKVIEGHSKVCITSCASIDSNVIACGKCSLDSLGDGLDGLITLYDRQWKVIRDISIPKSGISEMVYVDVDRDGMILAARSDQSNIYVINPADGKIVSIITMQGKEVQGKIQSLSSGDIVVKTYYYAYSVISRSGEEKAVIHSDDWSALECGVDKLRDTLYITYWDDEDNVYTVDQASCDGIVMGGIVVYDRYVYISPCPVTWPFGEIYAASKFALEGFTESLSIGYRPFNIWVSSCQPGPVKTAFIANMGSANNQPEFLKLTEEKNIDKESKEVCGMIINRLVNSPTFEEEQQTPEEIASVIKGALEDEKPHLRYATSKLRLDYAKKYFVDPTGDAFCDTIVPHIIPDSLKQKK
eukprot:XP_011660700.1 PREDICTED: uncharacterized protein LOC105436638 [Strongylocentrotus purpuratus]